MKHHILIVEDDKKISELLSKFLQNEGFLISTAGSIKECAETVKYFALDLIILDIMLPDDTGFNFLKENPIDIPVIILSAMGHVDDRVYGLEIGARDYMTKPFDPRELLARIKNLLSQHNKHSFKFGLFTFDLNKGTLSKGSSDVHLTSSERDLLKILCLSPKTALSRDEIIEKMSDLNARSVDTMIARLRNKIEEDPKYPKHIITERNKGYALWP